MNLRELYEAAAEDVVFGMGFMPVSEGQSAPYLHSFYRDWSREMLEVVRESFGSGLTLVASEHTAGRINVFVATRERVAVHGFHDGETTILRAAAWDAQLSDVDATAFRVFDDKRVRQGRYLVQMQTPEWEFLTGVNVNDPTVVRAILRRTLPMPPTAA